MCMNLYWIWLLFNAVAWSFAILGFSGDLSEITWRLFGLSLFLYCFFMPLVKEKPVISTVLIAINAVISVIILFPQQGEQFNLFLLLILSLLIGEAYYQLSTRLASIIAIVSTIGVIFIILNKDLSATEISFILLYLVFLIAAIILYKQTKNEKDDFFLRYDVLLSEYRSLKRRVVSEGESARQEERTLIAHEIHDSVGHKLTALLMQMEAYRLTADEKIRSRSSL